ncbi:MAG: SRPBCC family protein [Dehalococcoidia bacterium]
MKSFATTIVIRASAGSVWDILTDLPAWPSWNTTVDRVEGRVALGETVRVWVKLSPGRAFPVKVKELTAPSRMVWGSGMPLGLFKGERVYTLTPLPDGAVEFSMREAFTGPLSGLIGKSIPDMQPAFEEFAACLKAKAEAP